MLIGVNLLREGLDLPEVSLVAILDADKEGFLRSTRSIIQTIGRAARNLNGKAILYGDRITDSMRTAIDETERRRAVQQAFNLEHGITPKGLNKKVVDVMQLGGVTKLSAKASRNKVAEEAAHYQRLRPDALAKEIKRLENQMFEHARNLEFEQAAGLRDQIHELQQQLLLG